MSDFYNGTKAKKAGVLVNYTENQIEELKKCANDIPYFLSNYAKIITLDKGIQLFKPHGFQINMVNDMSENRFTIFKLPRQMGKCVVGDTKIIIKQKNTVRTVSLGWLFKHAIKYSGEVCPPINKKFNVSLKISKLNIKVWDGAIWKPIRYIHQTFFDQVYEVVTVKGLTLKCSDEHPIIDHKNEIVFAKDLVEGYQIKTSEGNQAVREIIIHNKFESMYDISLGCEERTFLTNGILSHNTTTVNGVLLHQSIFQPDISIAILANKGDTARKVLARLKFMYEELPWWMQPGIRVWNKGDIELSNNSRIITGSSSESSIRGDSVNILYLDEFAHLDNAEEFYQSVYPVISSGRTTKIIITSTPNGLNLFYKIFNDAKLKKNKYFCREVHWSDHPERDERWFDEQCNNLTSRQVKQEILCEFLGSSNTLISGAALTSLTEKEQVNNNEFFKIYEYPVENNLYVVTADVSEGTGNDYSAVSVFDVSRKPFKQVATYQNNEIHPITFAKIIEEICIKYNKALLIVENNSVGSQTADVLWNDLEYENMFTSRVVDSDNVEWGGAKFQKGVRTTKKTKMIGCSTLKSLIEENLLEINDFETIKELSTFVHRGTSYSASGNGTDDLVMTLVIFAWFTNQNAFKELTEVEVNNEVLSKQGDIIEAMGFLDDGIYEQDGYENIF